MCCPVLAVLFPAADLNFDEAAVAGPLLEHLLRSSLGLLSRLTELDCQKQVEWNGLHRALHLVHMQLAVPRGYATSIWYVERTSCLLYS